MIDPVIISIHALREEGDGGFRRVFRHRRTHFNPRPPRGGRHASRGLYPPPCYFNPRPPRGGRPGLYGSLNHNRHFNPRPPRGGRPPRTMYVFSPFAFQSTPSARRATDYFNPKFQNLLFQSTPSARRATYLFHYW